MRFSQGSIKASEIVRWYLGVLDLGQGAYVNPRLKVGIGCRVGRTDDNRARRFVYGSSLPT